MSGLIGVKGFLRRSMPIDRSRLTLKIKCIVIFGCDRCFRAFNGAQFFGAVEIGDGSDGSGDWGLYFWSCRVTALVANTLNGLGGKLGSLRLGSTIGCWLPNPYGIAGSLESESIVTICVFRRGDGGDCCCLHCHSS